MGHVCPRGSVLGVSNSRLSAQDALSSLAAICVAELGLAGSCGGMVFMNFIDICIAKRFCLSKLRPSTSYEEVEGSSASGECSPPPSPSSTVKHELGKVF